jgi:DNA polymerase-3 subunit epsilon
LGRSKLSNPIVDTVSLARQVLNTRVANLDYLCRRFKVDLSERDLHGALLDSRLLAEVYLELRGGKQFSMNLAKKNQETNKTNKSKTTNQKNITKFTPLKEDVELHRLMVSEIKQSVWKKYSY